MYLLNIARIIPLTKRVDRKKKEREEEGESSPQKK
jgi:hypothetical protein